MIYLARIAFAVAFVAITYLALTPISIAVTETLNDKLNHLLAFFVLTLLADYATSFTRKNSIIVVLVSYGLIIELLQHFIPPRVFSLIDWMADIIGILLYLLIRGELVRRLFQWRWVK